jgi:hypothetical protein
VDPKGIDQEERHLGGIHDRGGCPGRLGGQGSPE